MSDHIGDANEMVFTDDDLKRLKIKVSNNPKKRDFLLMHKTVEALLARLEAAEDCLEFPHMKHTLGVTDDGIVCAFCNRYQSWRKACGRE